MTINDQELNELCIRIRRLAEATQVQQRDGQEPSLFIGLADIEKYAHRAQIRLNEIRWGKS